MKFKIRKGTTLIEILIAMGILAMAIIPMFGLLSFSDRGTRAQDAEGIAANLAKEEMNNLMNVVTRNNLKSAIGTPTSWPLGDDYDVKGNKFTGKYVVHVVDNKNLNFVIPKLTFHDPRTCNDNQETHTGVINATPKTVNLHTALPSLPNMIMDIKLVVTWRLANEKKYNPKNKFVLVARRSFLVKN